MEDGVHLLPEAGEEKGLGEERVHARFPGLLLNFRPVAAGEDDEGRVCPHRPPDFPGGLHPVHARHLPVQHGDVIEPPLLPGPQDHVQRRPAVRGAVHGDAGALHGHPDALTDGLLIVHRQNPGHAVFLPEALVNGLPADGQLQLHRKGGAPALPAVHRDASAHQVQQVLGNGHPQAGPLDFVGYAVLLPGKGLEDALLVGLAHAIPVVRDDKPVVGQLLGVLGQLLNRQDNVAALRGILHRVGQQIQENLVQAELIHHHLLVADILAVDVKDVPLGLHLGADDGINPLDEVHYALIRQVQGGFARLDLADVQDVVDEPQQVLAGGGDFPGVLPHLFRVVRVSRQQGGKPHDGVHRRADIVAHVGEEGAFGPVGLLGDPEGLLRRLLGLGQHGVGLLQLLIHLLQPAHVLLLLAVQTRGVPLPGGGDGGQHQQHHQHHRQRQQGADDRPHHAHGSRGHKGRGDEKQQQGIILLQGREAVVIFGAVVLEIGADRAQPGQLGADIRDFLSLHLLQDLEDVIGLDGAALGDAVVHPGAVAFQDIGLAPVSVGRAVVILAEGIHILEQDGVGKADVPRLKRLLQLLHKGPVAALVDVGVGNEGVALLPAGELADVHPDAVLSLRVVAVPPAVQQHQLGAVLLHAQKPFQHGDAGDRILLRLRSPGLQQVHRGGQIIPVGVQRVAQVHLHLSGNLIELGGPLLENPVLQVTGKIQAARQRKQQQTGRHPRRQRGVAAFPLRFHMRPHPLSLGFMPSVSKV